MATTSSSCVGDWIFFREKENLPTLVSFPQGQVTFLLSASAASPLLIIPASIPVRTSSPGCISVLSMDITGPCSLQLTLPSIEPFP